MGHNDDGDGFHDPVWTETGLYVHSAIFLVLFTAIAAVSLHTLVTTWWRTGRARRGALLFSPPFLIRTQVFVISATRAVFFLLSPYNRKIFVAEEVHGMSPHAIDVLFGLAWPAIEAAFIFATVLLTTISHAAHMRLVALQDNKRVWRLARAAGALQYVYQVTNDLLVAHGIVSKVLITLCHSAWLLFPVLFTLRFLYVSYHVHGAMKGRDGSLLQHRYPADAWWPAAVRHVLPARSRRFFDGTVVSFLALAVCIVLMLVHVFEPLDKDGQLALAWMGRTSEVVLCVSLMGLQRVRVDAARRDGSSSQKPGRHATRGASHGGQDSSQQQQRPRGDGQRGAELGEVAMAPAQQSAGGADEHQEQQQPAEDVDQQQPAEDVDQEQQPEDVEQQPAEDVDQQRPREMPV